MPQSIAGELIQLTADRRSAASQQHGGGAATADAVVALLLLILLIKTKKTPHHVPSTCTIQRASIAGTKPLGFDQGRRTNGIQLGSEQCPPRMVQHVSWLVCL